ncbi:hypothetical protein A6P54_07860 [Bacillus sp. MKU004]|nr:hypothetical protein A6P54_07860 [Bacillus sp. MKU004]
MVKAIDYLIALDDGHGLGTSGKRTPYIPSIGRQIRENEFNEKVTLYLKGELERCGFRTLLTAPTDGDTPLKERRVLPTPGVQMHWFPITSMRSTGNLMVRAKTLKDIRFIFIAMI